MAGDQPQRRRLFGITALVSAVMISAVIGYLTIDYALKRNAIRRIEAAGGIVYFSDEPPHAGRTPRTFQDELRQFAGLRRPVVVEIYGHDVTDATLDDDVRALSSLERIALVDVAVTDQAVLRLKSLRSLEDLVCTRDPRNAAVFDEVADLTKIEFTDVPLREGLAYLADYHNIRFEVDTASLAAAGLRDDLPITYETVTAASLSDALDDMLAVHKLGWYVRDGAVVVTSQSTAKKANNAADTLRRDLPGLKHVRIDAN